MMKLDVYSTQGGGKLIKCPLCGEQDFEFQKDYWHNELIIEDQNTNGFNDIIIEFKKPICETCYNDFADNIKIEDVEEPTCDEKAMEPESNPQWEEE